MMTNTDEIVEESSENDLSNDDDDNIEKEEPAPLPSTS